MKLISDANLADYECLLNSIKEIKGKDSVEKVAQIFIDIIFDYFKDSIVLLRLFSTVPYSVLPEPDKQLVDNKAINFGNEKLYTGEKPILVLLGTKGQRSEWNERQKSQGFRCIPLVSSEYVSSLSMLSMQFKKMKFDFKYFDTWDTAIVGKGRADEYSGMLYVKNANVDKDELGRMVVPRQEFVAENAVKTAFGFGGGYPNHPTIVTLFGFTNKIIDESLLRPFSMLLEAYIDVTKELVGKGCILYSEDIVK